MLVIRVKIQVVPQNKATLIKTLQEDIAISRQFAGCVQFNLYQDMADDNNMLLYEEWESSNQFDVYKASDHFKKLSEKLFPLMAGDPDSAYYQAELVK